MKGRPLRITHCDISGYLHTEYDAEKMSKSLKNTISVKEFLENYSANQFRMFCMLTHYRNRECFLIFTTVAQCFDID